MKRHAILPLLTCLALCTPLYFVPAAAQDAPPNHAQLFGALEARCIGPANMSGRITAIDVVESNPDIIYVGAATGGVWKSTDGGKRWTSIFDEAGSLCIGDVAVSQSHPEVVWVGTGEANVLRSVSSGDGIYKSTDGGKTWKNMGLTDSRHIARIVIHPSNPDIVYVAVLGHGFGPNKERGLYKTTDGGRSWQNTKFIDDTTGFIDLAMDPTDPQTLYAAAYTMLRDAFSGTTPRVQWSKVSGLYKTVDGGKTWDRLTEGLPARPLGRLGLTVQRKNPSVLYALVQTDRSGGAKGGKKDTEPGGQPSPGPDQDKEEKKQPGQPKGGKGKDDPDTGGIYRSADKGKTWTRVNGLNTQFPFYFGQIRVDPNDEQRVYVLGVPISLSTDGGKTFTSMPAKGVHVDHHALWINSKDSGHMILGNDGGLYITRNKGGQWNHVTNLPVGQYYAVGVDMKKPYWVYGGLQDNGSWGGPSATRHADGILLSDCKKILGADGFYCQVDPTDPDTVFAETQNGGLSRLNLKAGGKGGSKSIRPGGKGQANRFNWCSPILMSPHDPKTIYFGGNHLFKSTNRGDTWETLGPDLSSGGKAGDTGHTIVTIAESPLKAGFLLVGTDDGLIHLSKNGGKEWINLSEKLLGPKNRYITRVEWSAHAQGTAYVTIDRHREDDLKPYIFKTTDYGETWQSLAKDLPKQGPVHVIRESSKNPSLLFVGTEWGLYGSLDGGQKWHHLKKGIPPKVLVHDLVIHPRDRELVVGTHGRSIYIVDIAALEQLTPKALAEEVYLCAIRPAVAYEPKQRAKDAPPPEYAGQNPPYGAVVSYYLKDAVKQPVSIIIRGAKGNQVAELKGPAASGLHTVVWDLHFGGGGILVQPGEYTARITIGDRVLVSKIQVEAP